MSRHRQATTTGRKEGEKMNTGKHDAALHFDPPTDSSEPSRNLRQWWIVVSALLVAGIFTQAVFAGLMLSGVEWGRSAHSVNAIVLIASTLGAGLVSLITLRRVPYGLKLSFVLLSLAVVVSLQTAIGKSSVEGANLMWIHIPLGVALVGFAAQAVANARRLGGG